MRLVLLMVVRSYTARSECERIIAISVRDGSHIGSGSISLLKGLKST